MFVVLSKIFLTLEKAKKFVKLNNESNMDIIDILDSYIVHHFASFDDLMECYVFAD